MSLRGLPLEFPKNKEEMVRGLGFPPGGNSLCKGRERMERAQVAYRACGLRIGRADLCYGKSVRGTECMRKKK